jgi:hypothetical protein
MTAEVLRDLQARYRRETASEDPVVRRVATLQLERLEHGRRRQSARLDRQQTDAEDTERFSIRPYRQQLQALLEAGGNPPVRWRGEACYQTGHRPFHASKSSTCLVVWLETGTYWCSSCNAIGGAIEWVSAWKGISRRRAQLALAQKFGDGAP